MRISHSWLRDSIWVIFCVLSLLHECHQQAPASCAGCCNPPPPNCCSWATTCSWAQKSILAHELKYCEPQALLLTTFHPDPSEDLCKPCLVQKWSAFAAWVVPSTIIVGHEHTYMKFDVIRQSDVNQNPAADCYTLTADIPAVGSLLEPHYQLAMDQYDELINHIVQVRHILVTFRRRD